VKTKNIVEKSGVHRLIAMRRAEGSNIISNKKSLPNITYKQNIWQLYVLLKQ